MSIDYRTSSKKLSPRPMTDHSMAILNRRLFLYGDHDASDDFSGIFWQYDIHWNNWFNINKPNYMSFNCLSSKIVVEDRWCYVIECEENIFNNGNIKIARLDSEKYTWNFLTNFCDKGDTPSDTPDDVISMFHYGDSLYLFSVICGHPSYNMISRYSLKDNSWSLVEQKGEIPHVMYNIYGTVFNDRYYCLGDIKYYTKDIFHYIHIFDLKTYEWSQEITYPDFDQYPCDRIETSISFTETHGFLSGGRGKSDKILDDLWCIDLRTLKWHRVNFVSIKKNKNIKHKIMAHASAIYDNSSLFLFGGIINNVKVNILEKYIIETPSLYNLGVCILLKNTKKLSDLEQLPISLRKNILPLNYESSISDKSD